MLGLGSDPAAGEKKKKSWGHEGIEPSTSPTLKENHTTRPMALGNEGRAMATVCVVCSPWEKKGSAWSGIRTHASEDT